MTESKAGYLQDRAGVQSKVQKTMRFQISQLASACGFAKAYAPARRSRQIVGFGGGRAQIGVSLGRPFAFSLLAGSPRPSGRFR